MDKEQSILEKLQEFCKQNNLELCEYKILSEGHPAYKWRVVLETKID